MPEIQTSDQKATFQPDKAPLEINWVKIAFTSCVVTVGLLLAYLATFVPVSGSSRLPILVFATGVVLATPMVVRAVKGRLDPFEPMVCFAFVWALMFVMKPLEILATGDTSIRKAFDVQPGIVPASVLGLIGDIAFLTAYEFTLGRRRQNAEMALYESGPWRPEWSRRPPRVWFIATVIGVATLSMFTLAGTSLTSFGGSGQSAFTYLIPLLSISGIGMLLLKSQAGSERATILAFILLGVSVAFFILFGQRAFILLPISSVFIYYYMSRRRRPRWPTLLLIGLVVVLPVFTVVEVQREKPTEALTSVIQEPEVTSPKAALERFGGGDSTAMFSALALQMSTEGTAWHQKPGSEIESIAPRLVPKAIWPGKPRSSSEELYSRYFPYNYAVNRAGTLFTLVSEFYYDLGMIGVILGMSLVGWAYARLWSWVVANPKDPWTWAIYAPVWLFSTIEIGRAHV